MSRDPYFNSPRGSGTQKKLAACAPRSVRALSHSHRHARTHRRTRKLQPDKAEWQRVRMREWISCFFFFFLGRAKPSNIKVPGINNPSTKRDIWPAQRGVGGQSGLDTFLRQHRTARVVGGGRGASFTALQNNTKCMINC